MANSVNRKLREAAPRISRRHLLTYMVIFIVMPILTFFTGRWLDSALSLPRFPPFPSNLIIGLGLFFFGLFIGIKSTRLLLKVGKGLPWGELSEDNQTRQLVKDGLYAYCRNPMTFGYSLLPFGMGVMFQSIGMAIFIPSVVFTIAVVWVKIREEPSLKKRFGTAYEEYKRTTPFLIPRLKPLLSRFLGAAVRQEGNTRNKKGALTVWSPVYLTGISILGLVFLAVMVSTPSVAAETPSNYVLTATVFSAICILGTLAGISPSPCSRILHFRTGRKQNPAAISEGNRRGTKPAYIGHHPACDGFAPHVFRFSTKSYCAGCTGLVVGGAVSLIGNALYFFTGMRIGGMGALFFWTGLVGVVFGLFQYQVPVKSASVHLLLNVVFVTGAFSVLVGVHDLRNSFNLELFFLLLVVLWILDRIMLSQLEHRKICARCKTHPCDFRFS